MAWKIFFDDGQSIKQKVGEIVDKDETFIYILISGRKEAIPKINIKRMEEVADG